jgi:serine/threonine protein kinase
LQIIRSLPVKFWKTSTPNPRYWGSRRILEGRDTDLGRDLAVKLLLDRHHDHPDMVRRFVEEPQIGGQLQHPGVVLVRELGQFADQWPDFAMRLVKGRTLAALLDEHTAGATDLPVSGRSSSPSAKRSPTRTPAA